MTDRLSAAELIELVLDAGSFKSWNEPVPDFPTPPEYAAELAAARALTGLDESVLTGEGLLRGRRVAVVAAEPGALIGFLGPRVYEALYGHQFPQGVQVSENLYAHGRIDAVVPADQIADIADRALRVLTAPREVLPRVPELPAEAPVDVPAWESVTRSRRPERPGVRELGLSPLPPEGASAILHRTVDRGPEMAHRQGVRSADLLASGIVDRIVPEHPDAADEPAEFCRRTGQVLRLELVRLLEADPRERYAARLSRYRGLGLGERSTR